MRRRATFALAALIGALAVVPLGGPANADPPADCVSAGEVSPAYRSDRIVLSTTGPDSAARDAVVDALRTLGDSSEVTGVERISLPGTDDDSLPPVVAVSLRAPAGRLAPVLRVARQLRDKGIVASPDYELQASDGPIGVWPDGYPSPVDTLTPPRDASIGAGVTIAVYDTGLAGPAQSNPPANVNRLTSYDAEQSLDTTPADGIADHYYGGHTVAIAGVLATLAPGASVVAVRITLEDGVATDISAARRMANTLRGANAAGAWPDLIVNAFGTSACDIDVDDPDTGKLEPLGLRMVSNAVRHFHQSLIVASAGNMATDEPYYPAAFDPVVAVGALDATADTDGSPWTSPDRSGSMAEFSNHGPWVDAWAPGVDLPTNHVTGLRFTADGPVINGRASVNGTSFAAPYAAALIAEQMAATGQGPAQAWVSVAAAGTVYSADWDAGSGSRPAVAIALTDLAGTAHS